MVEVSSYATGPCSVLVIVVVILAAMGQVLLTRFVA